MKNLIRTSTGELERNPNALMHCGEFDPRQVHDHQHPGHSPHSSCFALKSEHLSALEQQQRLFPCANGPHILPMATRSYSCSQLSGLVDYSSETIKQQQQQQQQSQQQHQHQCKSETHDEDGALLSGKCQMHSNSGGSVGGGSAAENVGGAGILVKSEFNEMQQSKSSPVHEVFEMTSSTFTSNVTGSGSSTGQFHHDSGSPPLPLIEAANSSSSAIVPTVAAHHLQHHHHNHHHHQANQHQCSAHSYESYVYATGSGGRTGMSPRQPPATMNTTSSGSEISGALYNCKSFFADSGSGSTAPGIAAFYQNSSGQQQHHQANGESCRDDSTGFPSRDSLDTADEKVVIAIKARKMPD